MKTILFVFLLDLLNPTAGAKLATKTYDTEAICLAEYQKLEQRAPRSADVSMTGFCVPQDKLGL